MAKIFRFSFYRTKQPNPLEEEEESLVAAATAAGECRDLEDGGNGDETVGPGVKPRAEGALVVAVIVAYFMSAIGIYYLLLGNFYLPPEAEAADGGRVIAIVGGVVLAVAGPVLVGGLTFCCCCRSPRGPVASAVED